MKSSKKIGTVMMIATSILILAVTFIIVFLAAWMLTPSDIVVTSAPALLWAARFGLGALILSGGAAIWFLIELLLIMNSVRLGKAFAAKTVSALKRMAVCCIIACAAFAGIAIALEAPSYGICAGILAFGALAVFTLACVFKEAVSYKEENDLTI